MKASNTGSLRAHVVTVVSLLLMMGSFLPSVTHAGIIGDFFGSFLTHEAAETPENTNIQNLTLARPAANIDPSPARGGGDISIIDDSALVPDEGPSGTIADVERPRSTQISRYVVREGDTLERIARMFEVSPNTVRWTNNLDRKAVIKPGQELTILPISGIAYTVKRGDTLASIAKATGGDADEIALFNDISGPLASGMALIIPDGELSTPAPVPTTRRTIAVTSPVRSAGVGTDDTGYYLSPLAHYVRTQGVHGYNAVDLAAPVGTPIYASASGDVILARTGSWNGGYGNYVVITHANGSQTLYAHQSRLAVGIGEHVVKGQIIGYVGNTGRSTGPHLHFEIRGGPRNPFR